MTSPLTLIVEADGRKLAKPVEEVARALADAVERTNFDVQHPLYQQMCRLRAQAALKRLAKLGFLNDSYFVAKKAEEAEAKRGSGT